MRSEGKKQKCFNCFSYRFGFLLSLQSDEAGASFIVVDIWMCVRSPGSTFPPHSSARQTENNVKLLICLFYALDEEFLFSESAASMMMFICNLLLCAHNFPDSRVFIVQLTTDHGHERSDSRKLLLMCVGEGDDRSVGRSGKAG